MRRLAPLILGAVLLLAVLGFGGAALLGVLDAPGEEAADEADPADAPVVLSTTFEHFDGRVVRLSDWTGAPMVVNWWASWCPPCVAEMSAAFEPVHQELADRVTFVGLNLEDDPQRAAEIVERTGVTYDLGRDPVGEMFTAFGGFGMPTTVFLDEAGAVVDTHTGALSRGQLETLIARSFDVHVP